MMIHEGILKFRRYKQLLSPTLKHRFDATGEAPKQAAPSAIAFVKLIFQNKHRTEFF